MSDKLKIDVDEFCRWYRKTVETGLGLRGPETLIGVRKRTELDEYMDRLKAALKEKLVRNELDSDSNS